MDTLKPCPFCGSKANLVSWVDNAYGGHIGCLNPECVACAGTKHVAYGSDEAAIKAWNKRTSEWVSVEDRLPEETGQYLVWYGNHSEGIGVSYYFKGQGWHYGEVKYWQTISPPKGDE